MKTPGKFSLGIPTCRTRAYLTCRPFYARIFWLERTLLAYERAPLAEWRKRVKRQRVKDGKPYVHTRIAHDDVSIGVNWETRADRRITQLNCSVSADIRSG